MFEKLRLAYTDDVKFDSLCVSEIAHIPYPSFYYSWKSFTKTFSNFPSEILKSLWNSPPSILKPFWNSLPSILKSSRNWSMGRMPWKTVPIFICPGLDITSNYQKAKPLKPRKAKRILTTFNSRWILSLKSQGNPENFGAILKKPHSLGMINV